MKHKHDCKKWAYVDRYVQGRVICVPIVVTDEPCSCGAEKCWRDVFRGAGCE